MNTIAIFYTDAIGENLARILIKNKYQVVTDPNLIAGQSASSFEGFGVLPMDINQIAKKADLVISMVSSDVIFDVVMQYLEASLKTKRPAQFVDMSCKSVEQARKLIALFEKSNVFFTNASLLRNAENLSDDVCIYFCGEHRHVFKKTIHDAFKFVYLGTEPLLATAFELCYSGFTKSLMASLFETAFVSNYYGITERLFSEFKSTMPGAFSDLEKSAINYQRDMKRKCQELQYYNSMLSSENIEHSIASATERIFNRIVDNRLFRKIESADATLVSLIKRLK
ncbi:NAD(P)-binding domain-containing protein [Sphingobacterium hungaricum]